MAAHDVAVKTLAPVKVRLLIDSRAPGAPAAVQVAPAEIGQFALQALDLEAQRGAAGEDQRHGAAGRIGFVEFHRQQIEGGLSVPGSMPPNLEVDHRSKRRPARTAAEADRHPALVARRGGGEPVRTGRTPTYHAL